MTKEKLFKEYIENNLDKIYRFSLSYVKNSSDAEDVVNESVLKALKSLYQLRDMDKINSWFFMIVSNTARTYLKKKSKIVYLSDELMDQMGTTVDTYSDISFDEMVKSLSPIHKEVIILKFFEDMTIKEISKVLSCNENTIKTRLYKAIEILKLDLGGIKHEQISYRP